MDLLRLALERGKTAKEALDTIIRLLEEYGQGGNCGYRHKLLYMNSYLIADAAEAYVLECVKSWWAWKKVSGVWSISNVISLGRDFDAASPGLIENAIKKGWCKGKADFDFKRCYSEPIMTWGAAALKRQDCSRKALTSKHGALTTTDFFAILRDHGGREDEFRPEKHGWTVCVHAANQLLRPSQSVASFVGSVSSKGHFYYATGAANPCLSPFFPVFSPGTVTPAGYLEGKAEYDKETYWWYAEKLHRKALHHFPAALKSIKPRIAEYESEMLRETEGAGNPPNQAAIDKSFSRARAIVGGHGEELTSLPAIKHGWLYSRYWQGFNKLNAVE
jgi:dipeptidase